MPDNIPDPTCEQIEKAIQASEEAFANHRLDQPKLIEDNPFQCRLNALIQITGVTYRQVERGTRGVVSQHQLWQFRSGRSKNPNYKTLAALADFFKIPVGYFFASACDDEIAYLLPCIDEAGRQRVKQMAAELLEEQLVEFSKKLRNSNKPAHRVEHSRFR